MVAIPAAACARIRDSLFERCDLLEALALGDLRYGADQPAVLEVGDCRDLAARREPAHRAVRDERAILGLKMTCALHRTLERAHQSLEVLGVHGREPVVSREREPMGSHADEAEEKRRARDLPARKIEIEQAEPARVLCKAKILRRAAKLRLALLPLVKCLTHARSERIEFIALWRRRVRIGDRRERGARLGDAPGDIVGDRVRDHGDHYQEPGSRDRDRDAAARREEHEPGQRGRGRWRRPRGWKAI